MAKWDGAREACEGGSWGHGQEGEGWRPVIRVDQAFGIRIEMGYRGLVLAGLW